MRQLQQEEDKKERMAKGEEFPKEQDPVKIRIDPGLRTSTLISKGEEFGQVICTREVK